jgi:hypothetical protein
MSHDCTPDSQDHASADSTAILALLSRILILSIQAWGAFDAWREDRRRRQEVAR